MPAPTRPGTPRSRRLVGIALLGAWACTAPPKFTVNTPHGRVFAGENELATEAAGIFLEAREELRKLVPDAVDGPVDVWLQEQPSAGPFLTPGATFHAFALHGSWIRRARIHLPEVDYRTSLVHELVHLMLGESWWTLPQALEEGLCDVLSLMVGIGSEDLRLLRLQSAAKQRNTTYELIYDEKKGSRVFERVVPWTRRVEQDPSTSKLEPLEVLDLPGGSSWMRRSGDDLLYAYGVGYVFAQSIVENIGVEGLHALCIQAEQEGLGRIPAARILEASGFSGESAIARHIEQQLYVERVAVALRAGDIEQALRQIRASVPRPPRTIADFLWRFHPRMRVCGGPAMRLDRLPGFTEWMPHSRWNEPLR